ncbi:G-type lectin S-receptor-like serine/threonine-protein kinase At4g27290 isoform X2 [Typha angustifolia]|uniref:G-type lectin S-receptor-like serine/threonine-protein kinase At4g27290 isoform X2 n=1 Tax=Typha angustifolia TaxID=59011 RepID=UPI003C30D327
MLLSYRSLIMVRRRSYCCNGCCMLLYLVVLSVSRCKSSSATSDTLFQYESLSDGKTLVSANKTFEFGFFTPEGSSNRYVGIWYHGIRNQTVVWVANRNNPLMHRSGTLRFNDDGDLIVVDGRGSWLTVSDVSKPTGLVKAILFDSGNLVISSVNYPTRGLWQSFDNPTNTWLPGMELGHYGGQNRLLTSWRDYDDPSDGDFSFGTDPNGAKKLFIWHKETVYWTSGLWNGKFFPMIRELPLTQRTDSYFQAATRVRSNETYYIYSAENGTLHLSRFMIDNSGRIRLLVWREEFGDWFPLWQYPKGFCDAYDVCGPFGVCSELNQTCQCAKGFEPASPTDWDEGHTAGGCQRKTGLQCEGGVDGFLEMANMTFPPSSKGLLNAESAEECKLICLNNCSCTAYAFLEKCYLWDGGLVDLHQFGNDSTGNTVTIYLRLAASELVSAQSRGGKSKLLISRKLLIIAILVSLAVFIFCSILCYLCIRRHRQIRTKLLSHNLPLNALGTTEETDLWWSEQTVSQFTVFPFSQIAEATNNFSTENKLGEGGFGPVYKGQILEGQNVAVKRLAAHSGQGLVEFRNEILLIAKLQHRNLVRLLGCCIQGEEKLLVYEYMPNKSLDFFIFDQTRRALLDWVMRFHIIEGIAQGLLYLHKHSRLKIIHRDLKASNILLDGDMNPKISDFGLARIFGSNETQANTNRVVGTFGYMPPEYATEGLFSIKSDVFSFGVLLLEIISGTRNAGFHQHGDTLNLLSYGWELWKEGRWFELIDQSLDERFPRNEMVRCIHIALMCVQENAVDRPTMSEVVAMLSSESTALSDPKQPAFYTVRITAEVDATGDIDASCSMNVAIISTQDSR